MAPINMVRLIEKKKLRKALAEEEIRGWIEQVAAGKVPDYQTSALLMAIRLNGMSFEETHALTMAMTESGDRLRFQGYPILADKHSTGGVGDKVTLILAPLMAACGLPVSMLSGRGLGFTGGTIDKFESLSGVSCAHDNAGMQRMLDAVGWANAQASERIAPADRVLYALRDVTGTIDSIPLITASILSKKIAGGASHLCLDVKAGGSAFMTDLSMAKTLADNLKTIGTMAGLSVFGLISRMEEPLGHAAGNYLELLESVHYLRENVATPLMALVHALGEKMLVRTGRAVSADDAMRQMQGAHESGAALQKLWAYLEFTGGDPERIASLKEQAFDVLPRVPILAAKSGFVTGIDGRGLGEILVDLGAGRHKKDDVLDPMAGIYLAKHVGDEVREREVLAWLYGNRAGDETFHLPVNACYEMEKQPREPNPLVLYNF